MAKAKNKKMSPNGPIDIMEYLQNENKSLREKLDRMENERDNALRGIANAANLAGQPLTMFQPEALTVIQMICRRYKKLVAFARAHEKWEAELIMNDGSWGQDGSAATPTLTEEQYTKMLEIQSLRNEALEGV